LARRLKILLTGSNGFLGDYFVNHFKKDNFEISKLLRPDINHILELFLKQKETNSWRKHPKFIKKYDVLIHAASLSSTDCEKDPQNAYLINNVLTEILSDYCITNNCYFIFFSSVQVYGTYLKGTYSEETIISPKTIYSISKAKAEKYLLDKIAKNYLQGIILRIGNIVGLPINHNSKGWELFANSIVREVSIKKQITIKNNPNLRRNFLSINLLMNLLRKILNDKSNLRMHNSNILNVTMGKSMSLLEYAELVTCKYKKIYKQEVKLKLDEKLIKKVPYSIIENERLRNFLPSYGSFKLENNIIEILRFFKN